MIRLEQIPVLDDNYVYVVFDDAGDEVVVIDPATDAEVLSWLERAGKRLAAILNTHHHGDHTGGNRVLHEKTGCAVIGPERDRDRIDAITRGVVVGEVFAVAGLTFRVLDVKAHTRGHIAYALDAHVGVVVRHGHKGVAVEVAALKDRPALFVGDALFGAGCGRLFEGDGDDLFAALSVLDAEDDRALVCCAHEYTASNLRFALHAFPDVAAIGARARDLGAEMAVSASSIPTTLGVEKATNPFLLALRHPEPAAKALDLRQQKDSFRG